MRTVRNGLADRLLGMNSVTTLVGTFRGVPAIFSESPVPPSASGRYIVVRDAHMDIPWETKVNDDIAAGPIVPGTLGRIVAHDIGVYEDQTGDSETLESLAQLIRDAINRKASLLTVSGYGVLIAKASGPVEAPQSEALDNQVDGRIVTVELTIIKAS